MWILALAICEINKNYSARKHNKDCDLNCSTRKEMNILLIPKSAKKCFTRKYLPTNIISTLARTMFNADKNKMRVPSPNSYIALRPVRALEYDQALKPLAILT